MTNSADQKPEDEEEELPLEMQLIEQASKVAAVAYQVIATMASVHPKLWNNRDVQDALDYFGDRWRGHTDRTPLIKFPRRMRF